MGLQAFLDSATGAVIGTTLHTVGAVAMVASVVVYWSWVRQMREGARAVGHLQTAAVLGYLAVVTNLVGGFMRTFESAHPHLTQFATEPWVQVVAIKHVFLFAAMGALIVLFEIVAPRVLRLHKNGRPLRWNGNGAALSVVVVGILVASVLGALAQVTPVEGHDEGGDPDPTPFAGRSYHFQGQLTGTPVAEGRATGTFDVPAGTASVQLVLDWTPAAFDLALDIAPPGGRGTTYTGTDGRVDVDVLAPDPGTWSYAIHTTAAVQAEWTLDVLVAGATTVIEDTVTIAPGSFHEINTEMAEGASFSWVWESSATVHFDVHSHFDGQVQYHVEKDAHHDEGAFTNDRAGGYSLLWANEGPSDVTLTYRVEGDFTLHSIVG